MPSPPRKKRTLARLAFLGTLSLALAIATALWLGGMRAEVEYPIRHLLGRLRGADQRSTPPLREICRTQGLPYPPPRVSLALYKARRVLVLLSDGRPLARYRVGLGSVPVGDKEREGDRRTPEGRFYVCTRLARSRFHRFLGLSYPAPDDADRGFATGRITRAEQRKIAAAYRQRRQPTWNTALGGAIGIHGGGSQQDWTLGCIAVSDAEIEELFEVLPLGTEIRIEP